MKDCREISHHLLEGSVWGVLALSGAVWALLSVRGWCGYHRVLCSAEGNSSAPGEANPRIISQSCLTCLDPTSLLSSLHVICLPQVFQHMFQKLIYSDLSACRAKLRVLVWGGEGGWGGTWGPWDAECGVGGSSTAPWRWERDSRKKTLLPKKMPFSKAHLEGDSSQERHSGWWDERHILGFDQYVALQIWTTNHRGSCIMYFFRKPGEVAAIMVAL